MNMSEQIDKIAPALVAIQESMVAVKDADNLFFKSKYAPLDEILESIRPALKENGLTVLQSMDTEGRKITCTTRIMHTTGQWIDSTLSLDTDKATPQGFGSAATYVRRYGVCAALSISTPNEDDDANKAEDDAKKAKAESAKVKLLEAEKVALHKYKARAFKSFMKFDVDPMSVSFENGGFVSEEADKKEWLRDVLSQVDSKEKLDFIGKDSAKRQEEFNATEKTNQEL